MTPMSDLCEGVKGIEQMIEYPETQNDVKLRLQSVQIVNR